MSFVPDLAQDEVIWVDEHGQAARIGSRRRTIEFTRPLTVAQAAMRTLLIELLRKAIERALLRAEVGFWGCCGGGFEGAMHAFVAAVLLRSTRRDTFRFHPQLEHPDAQCAYTAHRSSGKRFTMAGAECLREPVLAHGVLEMPV